MTMQQAEESALTITGQQVHAAIIGAECAILLGGIVLASAETWELVLDILKEKYSTPLKPSS